MWLNRLVLASALLILGLGQASAESAISGMMGRWQGEIDRTTGGAAAKGQATLALTERNDGFSIRWALPGRPAFEVPFEPDEQRQGVFQPSRDGLLSFLRQKRDGDPLDGEPLLWARTASQTLVVYSLGIEHDGGYVLDRLAFQQEGETIRAEFTRAADNAGPQGFTARLTKAGAR
jgi:hypothetical protein